MLPSDPEIVLDNDGFCQRQAGQVTTRVPRIAIRQIELGRVDGSPLPWPIQVVGGVFMISVGILGIAFTLWQWLDGRLGLSLGRYLLVVFVCLMIGSMMIYDAFRRKYIMLVIWTNEPTPTALHGMMTRNSLRRLIRQIELDYGINLTCSIRKDND